MKKLWKELRGDLRATEGEKVIYNAQDIKNEICSKIESNDAQGHYINIDFETNNSQWNQTFPLVSPHNVVLSHRSPTTSVSTNMIKVYKIYNYAQIY